MLAAVSELVECGLNEKEARVYLAMVASGAQKASEIARNSGLDRMDAYHILSKLHNKMLVEVSPGRPMRFIALPPDKALDRLIEQKKLEIERIGKTKSVLQKGLQNFSILQEERSQRVRFMQGRDQILSYVKRMFTSAGKEICIAQTDKFITHLVNHYLDDAIKQCRERGVQVRILVLTDSARALYTQQLARFTCVRVVRLRSIPLSIVVDGQQALSFIRGDGTGNNAGYGDIAMWTDSRNYVMGQHSVFALLWKTARPCRTPPHM